MTAVFAFLAILLATLTGHAGSPSAVASPSPLEHVVGHAHAPQVGPAPQRPEQVPARPDDPGNGHAEIVPPADDVQQEQLPEERIGRQVDCLNGQVGTVVDAAGDVDCPPSS